MASRGSSAARREPQRRPGQQRRKPAPARPAQAKRPQAQARQSVVIPFPAPQPRPKQRPRRRPLSREEAQRRQEIRLRQQAMEEEGRELAKGPIDLPFCLLVLLLMAIGLVMLLSASFPSAYYNTKRNDPTYYFVRQGVFAVMGVAAMLFIGKINYRRFRGVAKSLLYVSIFLLVFVAIPGNPVAVTVKGATRWIGVGDLFNFQPSEIAKMAIIIYFSDSISKKKDLMRSFRYGILPYAAILVVTAGLVAIEPHLSGAILILGAGAALMLVGGINWAWVLGALGAAAGMLYFALFVVGYNTSRIQYWLNPWADAQGKGYQLSQSLITIGSGGLLGVGLGKSRQKFLFLPEEHNDFIFAIICEELGLIGASIIMLLFAALILRGYWIALHARDRFGSLLVIGVTTLIAMQTFLNIGVVTGLLPTTGISLPFFSYGGSALSIQLAEMGVVLSVSRQMKPTKAG
ncbi:putative lipid II flippase FtsW [uncultured Oscillibacter sp.]|jgi:cell division protein FtsW|uniref:putative lipid II flippase FtsW n=1 Tax=uncultured Oscillibacter sp. TaxID=876091 RepID=UPI0025F2C864|nr:putative lipid II flippase FtsW [uncultured Oscillibacter sp.]